MNLIITFRLKKKLEEYMPKDYDKIFKTKTQNGKTNAKILVLTLSNPNKATHHPIIQLYKFFD